MSRVLLDKSDKRRASNEAKLQAFQTRKKKKGRVLAKK